MKSLLFILFVVVYAGNLRDNFASFRAKFKRAYLSSEIAYRTTVYNNNMAFAARENAKNHTYTLGVTPFADLTVEEFASSRLTILTNPPNVTRRSAARASSGFVPLYVNWINQGVITAVRDQGTCKADWAFAAAGMLESAHCIVNGEKWELSAQQILDCNPELYGCEGAWPTVSIDYTAQVGLCREDSYPYKGKQEECKLNPKKIVNHFHSYNAVPAYNGTELRIAVSKSPVVTTLRVDEYLVQLYTMGTMTSKYNGQYHLSALIYGYAPDYWMLKNSWGRDWGNFGFFRAYEEEGDGACGINMWAIYPGLEGLSVCCVCFKEHRMIILVGVWASVDTKQDLGFSGYETGFGLQWIRNTSGVKQRRALHLSRVQKLYSILSEWNRTIAMKSSL